jgi:8-oxo-dGTP pyrophosphatase MutT (NUDIX family)
LQSKNKLLENLLNYKKIDDSLKSKKTNYASVAVLFIDNNEILFIKRSENMPTHKGHIAFPGGKKEETDKSVVSTAIREATEELLIQENSITPFGYIDSVDTVEYKFEVFPILCFLKSKPENFNKDEVQKVLYAKIDNLMNETNWHYRGFYSNDWIFEIDNEILWGATAKMVRKILNIALDSNSDYEPHP